jgi:hypothetical protein
MSEAARESLIYAFVDIEADGPIPGPYSMLGFGACAYTSDGEHIDSFAANLSPLAGASQHPQTMAWWATHPKAWNYVTSNQQDPKEVMIRFRDWPKRLGGPVVMAAHPAPFDWMWIYWYLRFFLDENVFAETALDVRSYAMAKLDWDLRDCRHDAYPTDWLGGYAHSHEPLDDALGYAALFFKLSKVE